MTIANKILNVGAAVFICLSITTAANDANARDRLNTEQLKALIPGAVETGKSGDLDMRTVFHKDGTFALSVGKYKGSGTYVLENDEICFKVEGQKVTRCFSIWHLEDAKYERQMNKNITLKVTIKPQ